MTYWILCQNIAFSTLSQGMYLRLSLAAAQIALLCRCFGDWRIKWHMQWSLIQFPYVSHHLLFILYPVEIGACFLLVYVEVTGGLRSHQVAFNSRKFKWNLSYVLVVLATLPSKWICSDKTRSMGGYQRNLSRSKVQPSSFPVAVCTLPELQERGFFHTLGREKELSFCHITAIGVKRDMK